MKVTNLKGLQDGGSRLGQSVSILMNWRTAFEKRGPVAFRPKEGNQWRPQRIVRRPRRLSKAVVEPQGSTESPPEVFSVENSFGCLA